MLDELDDVFVIDAVAHGYNYAPENWVDQTYGATASQQLYALGAHYVPEGSMLPYEDWVRGDDPDLVASALFAESQTDFAVYHGVPMFGAFKDGGSPLRVGQEIRDRFPARMALFGAVSPWQSDPLAEIDRLVDEVGVIGIKLYPFDLVSGRAERFALDDPRVAFPLYERAEARGIKTVAVHKALPLGPVPIEPFQVTDIEGAAAAFPNLNFQIVHGGMAFVEETAWQLARFSNVSVNLEGTVAFAVRAPAQLAQILGAFLLAGAEDRIVWATGCMAVHPQVFLEAFWRLQTPAELVHGYGLPELTDDIKRKILGENAARILGLDITQLRGKAQDDQFAGRAELAPRWSRAAAGVSA